MMPTMVDAIIALDECDQEITADTIATFTGYDRESVVVALKAAVENGEVVTFDDVHFELLDEDPDGEAWSGGFAENH